MRIIVEEGDLTKTAADAVVNAANTDLQLGAGVAGAIRRAGGPSIQAECDRVGPVPLGEAAITGAGDLPARFVIHAASMSFSQATTEKSLHESTLNSMKRANENGLRSIAFPAIGTGVAGFPMRRCAEIMLDAVREAAEAGTTVETVRFVLFGKEAYETFRAAADERGL